MSAGERLVLFETKIEPLGSTSVHSWANDKVQSLARQGWEVVQIVDADKWISVLPGGEKLMALLRRPLPHPCPPLTEDGEHAASGWFPDPLGSDQYEPRNKEFQKRFDRYFDGEFWTVHLRDKEQWQEQAEKVQDELEKARLDKAADDEARKLGGQLTEQLREMGEAGEVFVGEPNEDSPEGWYLDWVMPSPNRYRFWDGSSTTSTVELTSN